MRVAMFVALVLAIASNLPAANPPVPHLRGSLDIHDPSTIIKHKDRYYIYGTGRNIISKQSSDRVYWTNGPSVFSAPPSWTVYSVPGFQDTFWAPDIIYAGGKFCLYYSVSTWGSQVSAIGLVTNPTLDPADPNYRWTDQGPVIESRVGSPYNTIDPSVTFDASGNLWMAFGSYWNGIYLVQLNPQTGKRVSTNSPVTRLAYNSSIEAAGIARHGPYYYLFVNWGSCCVGVNSTYHIRVGRSTAITGPYLDRNGVNLANNGGSVFMEPTGKYTGPGHAAVFSENGTDYLSYHYYDAGAWSSGYRAYGPSRFDIVPLRFGADGWPVFTNDWRAEYEFERDTTDSGGQYSGLARGFAAITNDPGVGGVLQLPGTNAWVQLPPGVAYARTFSALVKWNGGPAWQRIFDFGTDTSRYVMLTPSSGAGKLQCDIKAGGAVQSIVASQALKTGVWTHVALTFEGSRGMLYVGGLPVASNSSLTLAPFDVRAQTNGLGRSKFAADPDFNGQIANFRAYGRALSAQEIVAPLPSITSPSAFARYSPGEVIHLSGEARDFMGRSLPQSSFNWTVRHVTPTETNVVLGPVTGTNRAVIRVPSAGFTSPQEYYHVSLQAVDAENSTGNTDVFLFPNLGTNGATNESRSAFYPMDSGAQDALGNLDGTLMSGALILNDTVRGRALHLSGSGPHVSLPARAGDAQSVFAWIRWGGGSPWQRVFDFGRDTQRYFFLTPMNGVGRMQCAITGEARAYVHTIEAIAPELNRWTHVAVSLNGLEGLLYVNGNLTGVNNAINVLPSDFDPDRNYLGRSQFPNDPSFNGRIDSVRLDRSPRTIREFPSNGIPEVGLRLSRESESITLQWQQWTGATLLMTDSGTNSQWRPFEGELQQADGHWHAVVPFKEASARFYKLQYP